MPLFKKGGANFSDSRKGNGDKKQSSNRSSGVGADNSSFLQPTTQAPTKQPASSSNAVASRIPPEPVQPELRQPQPPPPPPKFVFYCQLAHGSPTGKVEGFTNVKELYQKLAEVFKVEASQVGTHLCLPVNLLNYYRYNSVKTNPGRNYSTFCVEISLSYHFITSCLISYVWSVLFILFVLLPTIHHRGL